MSKIAVRIQTWTCPSCGYHQDFDPDNAALMKLHFPRVEVGHCPACFLGQCPDKKAKKPRWSKKPDQRRKLP